MNKTLLAIAGAALSIHVQAQGLPADGLIAFYQLDGNALDASGTDRHGSIIGSPTSGSDRWGNPNGALYFGAGVDRIFTSDIPVDLAPGAFNTVSFWMNWSGSFYSEADVGAFPFFWGGGTGSVYMTGHQDWYAENVQTRLGLNGVAGHGETWGASNPPLEGWVHVAAVFMNGNITGGEIYVNGQLIEADLFFAPGGGPVSTWAGLSPSLGGQSNLNGQYQFLGGLDDVRIYNRALTAEEVHQLYAYDPNSAPVPEFSTVAPLGFALLAATTVVRRLQRARR